MQKVLLHFDTQNHYLQVDQFIQGARSTEIIVRELNRVFFSGKVGIKVVVLSPDEGSFLKKIGVIVITAGAYVMQGVISDFGSGYITGLTGKSPQEWGQEVAQENKEGIARLLSASTTGVLRKDICELGEIGISKNILPESLEAKSDFYKMCYCANNINAIGFTDKPNDFPISRTSFQNHMIHEDSDEYVYDQKLHHLIITHPATSQLTKAQWKTVDQTTGKNIGFYMQDESFISAYFMGMYPLRETEDDDTMVALIEYKKEKATGKILEKRAIKVYQFNNTVIDVIPEGISDKNSEILNNDNNQTPLF